MNGSEPDLHSVMVVLRRIASFLIAGALATPVAATLAQIPDLQEKADQLTAEVREQASEMRPLYRDVDLVTPDRERLHKLHNRRVHSLPALKPGHGLSKDRSTHAAPSRPSH